MDTCSRCERRVQQVHPVPPGVVTRELLDAFEHAAAPSDVELCGDCVNDLVDGTAVV